jgi:hypothetical protein
VSIDDQFKCYEEGYRRANPAREIPEGSPTTTARAGMGSLASGIAQDSINNLGQGDNGLTESAPSRIETPGARIATMPERQISPVSLDMGMNTEQIVNSPTHTPVRRR